MKLNELDKRLNESKEYVAANQSLIFKFDLANTILRARIEKGISQANLAKRVGTKQANISRIESGISNPTLDLITRIAQVLDIQILFKYELPNNLRIEQPNLQTSQTNINQIKEEQEELIPIPECVFQWVRSKECSEIEVNF